MFFFFPYVAGACYWLSGEAINLLSKIALLQDRYFETELYEDRAVGTALNYYGIRPYHYDLIAAEGCDTVILRRKTDTWKLFGDRRLRRIDYVPPCSEEKIFLRLSREISLSPPIISRDA